MHWGTVQGLALATLLHTTSALPASSQNSKLEIVKTTTLPDGQVIDWVKTASQGKIASPPPNPPQKRDPHQLPIEVLIPQIKELNGPKGTVPMAQTAHETKPDKKLPTKSDDWSVRQNTLSTSASNAGQHWYSSTAQAVANFGGKAMISLWNAYVQSPNDFSLLQTAVIRYNVPVSGGGTTMQTVEAGFINYPNQVQQPHLFSFYTTNGYAAYGDNLCGWNTEYKGWVQVDSSVYPGIPLGPLSVEGGTQYEFTLEYQLFQGNWWLYVIDRWIGYYPASLFTRGTNAAQTLESQSSQINWYGEIYNSEDALTTTDMGSGRFPETGFGHAAYIRNIQYTDTGRNYQTYDGSGQVIVSDQNRYRIETHFNSGTNYGSYFLLGGPGAGGVVGA